MTMDEGHNFSSKDEEVEHWKRIASEYKQSLDEAREELDEFQISSRELESELETQLEQAESKNRELVAVNSRLQMEVDMLRDKLEQQHGTTHKQLSELESELATVKAFKEELQRYIRELEQSNDDLERAKRSTVVSLEDFEGRLNYAIERNAFLESELEEREGLVCSVQRLKDEARDLKQELVVVKKDDTKTPRRPSEPETNEKVSNILQPTHIDSNKLPDNESYITPSSTPSKNIPYQSGTGTPLTPSARISALNIVGDLLRKVGALESKLASCRNFVKDQPRNNKSGSTSPLNSPSRHDLKSSYRPQRAKRLHRSATVGSASVPSSGAATQSGYVKINV